MTRRARLRGREPGAVDADAVWRTEPFRRELLAHCYRMTGSLDEAEDLLQETYLRAWRSYGGFEGRSSLRTWLYRIATNVCLTALDQRARRALPSGLGGPSDDPDRPPGPAAPGTRWLQPVPDALVTPDADDPAAVAVARDSLRLALIASLQHLPARQRAVLLLRDVLAFPAEEVAAMLDTTTAAIKSALQRARARLDAVAAAAETAREPTEPEARAVLDRYIAAFEQADPAALERVLRDDAAIELVGTDTWFAGKRTCVRYLARHALGAPGDWRMVATSANGQPAVAAYLRREEGTHGAWGVAVLDLGTGGISRIVVFGGPGLVGRFGLPPVHPG